MAYDLQLATATGYMEVSGEPPEGQRAFSHVLVNRLRDGRWGKTLAEVVLKAEQFSCWNTKDPNRLRLAREPESNPVFEQIEKYLVDALNGEDDDPTNGAKWYFNPKLAMPSWANSLTKTVDIGNHSFYKEP